MAGPGSRIDNAAPDQAPPAQAPYDLARALREVEAIGVSAAVIDAHGGAMFAHAGRVDRTSGERIGADTRFLSGSVGKTIAAAVAVQLVLDGELSLDERIRDYLGRESWFSSLKNGEAITVRMLLNHSAGVPSYLDDRAFFLSQRWRRKKGFAPEELIAFVAQDEPSGEPGRHFAYSDTHYILLGLIIEKATGRRYYDLAREMLIVPMGLTSTTPLTGLDHPGLATGYQRSGVARMIAGVSGPSVSKSRLVAVLDYEWTGGGFVTTPADLARLYHALFATPRFSAIASMMLSDDNVNPISEGRGYGLGVFVRERPEGDRLSHGGDFRGYGSFVVFDRETGLTVAVMTNDGDFEASDLAIQILSGLSHR